MIIPRTQIRLLIIVVKCLLIAIIIVEGPIRGNINGFADMTKAIVRQIDRPYA